MAQDIGKPITFGIKLSDSYKQDLARMESDYDQSLNRIKQKFAGLNTVGGNAGSMSNGGQIYGLTSAGPSGASASSIASVVGLAGQENHNNSQIIRAMESARSTIGVSLSSHPPIAIGSGMAGPNNLLNSGPMKMSPNNGTFPLITSGAISPNMLLGSGRKSPTGVSSSVVDNTGAYHDLLSSANRTQYQSQVAFAQSGGMWQGYNAGAGGGYNGPPLGAVGGGGGGGGGGGLNATPGGFPTPQSGTPAAAKSAIKSLISTVVRGLVIDAALNMGQAATEYGNAMNASGVDQGLKARATLGLAKGMASSIPFVGGLVSSLATGATENYMNRNDDEASFSQDARSQAFSNRVGRLGISAAGVSSLPYASGLIRSRMSQTSDMNGLNAQLFSRQTEVNKLKMDTSRGSLLDASNPGYSDSVRQQIKDAQNTGMANADDNAYAIGLKFANSVNTGLDKQLDPYRDAITNRSKMGEAERSALGRDADQAYQQGNSDIKALRLGNQMRPGAALAQSIAGSTIAQLNHFKGDIATLGANSAEGMMDTKLALNTGLQGIEQLRSAQKDIMINTFGGRPAEFNGFSQSVEANRAIGPETPEAAMGSLTKAIQALQDEIKDLKIKGSTN